MKTKISAGALRMAEALRRQGYIPDDDIQEWAALIDEQTGLPEILEALEQVLATSAIFGTGEHATESHLIARRNAKTLLAAQKAKP